MKSIKNQRGAALIEMVISIITGMGIIIVILQIIYVCCVSLWNQHNLYGGLVCLMEEKRKTFCEESVLRNIQDHLPFGKVTYLKLGFRGKNYFAHLKWEFNGKAFQKKLNLSYNDLYRKHKRIKRAFL